MIYTYFLTLSLALRFGAKHDESNDHIWYIYIRYILVPRQAVLAICVSPNQLQPFAVSMIPSIRKIRDVIVTVTLHPNMIPAHMSDTKGVTHGLAKSVLTCSTAQACQT